MNYALSAIAKQQFECPQCLRFVPRDTSKNYTCFLPPKWSISLNQGQVLTLSPYWMVKNAFTDWLALYSV
jgi:hypothetical protein